MSTEEATATSAGEMSAADIAEWGRVKGRFVDMVNEQIRELHRGGSGLLATDRIDELRVLRKRILRKAGGS